MNRIIGGICGSWRRAARIGADTRGTTAVEYALMAGGIALAVISTVFTLGDQVKVNLYDKLATLF
jgi:pilus assembly protein Flp/PilA